MPLGLDGRRTAGRHLTWKVRLFSAGAALAMAGIYLEERWLTLSALPVLVAGFLVRFLPDRSGDSEGGAGGDDEDERERDAE